jgi:hypothetical protein
MVQWFNGYRGPFPGVKRLGHKVDYYHYLLPRLSGVPPLFLLYDYTARTWTTFPLASHTVYSVVTQSIAVESSVSKEPTTSSFRRENGVQCFLRNVDRSHTLRETQEGINV